MTSFPYQFRLGLILIAGLCLIGLRSFAPSRESGRPFTKRAMMEDLAQQAIVPAYSNFAVATTQLDTASAKFCERPDGDSLAQVQKRWREAMLSWRSAQVIRAGPLLDVISRIHFWPIRRQSVEKVLRDSRPINEHYIAELGAPAVGLCAMEALLFDLKSGNEFVLAQAQGASAKRRRDYLSALSRDLNRQALSLVFAWTNSHGYAGKFIASGQDGLNQVVNDVLQAVEIATEERLRYALDLHENKLLKPEYVQGAATGISQQSVLEVMRGAHRIYAGGAAVFGLASQLASTGSEAGPRLENQFQAAIKALEGIGGPLEQVLPADRERVLRAYEECKKLEIMLKTELVSALGVTLTFSSTDGD